MNTEQLFSRLLISAVLGAFLLAPSSALANDFPKRKPGLWEISVVTDGPQSRPYSVKQCIDEASDQKMFQTGTDMMGKMGVTCAKNEMKLVGNVFTSESDCTMQGIRMESKGSFSGDFTSQYTGQATITYTPPMYGLSSTTSKFAAKFQGPCQAGQKPGDMILPDGTTYNINSLPQLPGR